MNVKTRWVQALGHLGIEEMTKFCVKLRTLGGSEQMGFGPTKNEFDALLARHGLNENLNQRRSITKATT